jgi:hypothetical protein
MYKAVLHHQQSLSLNDNVISVLCLVDTHFIQTTNLFTFLTFTHVTVFRSRVSEIQKWCGCPWATKISNFTCAPKILVAYHQQIFDEQQQQIIWWFHVLKYLVARRTTDAWQVLVHS